MHCMHTHVPSMLFYVRHGALAINVLCKFTYFSLINYTVSIVMCTKTIAYISIYSIQLTVLYYNGGIHSTLTFIKGLAVYYIVDTVSLSILRTSPLAGRCIASDTTDDILS